MSFFEILRRDFAEKALGSTSSFLIIVLAFVSGCTANKSEIASLQAPPRQQQQLANQDRGDVNLSRLTRLPTPNEVIESAGAGRLDPFAPPEEYPISLPNVRYKGLEKVLALGPQPTEAEIRNEISDLNLTGTSQVNGGARAYVTFEGDPGILSIGMSANTSGLKPTPFLPNGWKVIDINPRIGRLTIRKGLATANLYVGTREVFVAKGSIPQDAKDRIEGEVLQSTKQKEAPSQ